LPIAELIAASSEEARNTLAPWPKRFGKFLVEVETTVELAVTRA